jgi:hypothetical protein
MSKLDAIADASVVEHLQPHSRIVRNVRTIGFRTRRRCSCTPIAARGTRA